MIPNSLAEGASKQPTRLNNRAKCSKLVTESGGDLQGLQSEQNQLARDRDTARTSLADANAARQASQDRLTALRRETSPNAAAITAAETELTNLAANAQQLSADQSKAEAEFNNSKTSRVLELCLKFEGGHDPYKKDSNGNYIYHGVGLIKATADFKKDIKAPICDAAETAKSDGPCSKIKALREEANDKYVEYLKEQYKFEKCNVLISYSQKSWLFPAAIADETGATKTCEAEKKAMDTKSKELVAILAKIAKLEQEIAASQIFPVQEYFIVGNQVKTLGQSVTTFSSKIAGWLYTLIFSVAITALIIAGLLMVISAGNEERLQQGKDIFKMTIIGIILAMLSFGIIRLIQNIIYNV